MMRKVKIVLSIVAFMIFCASLGLSLAIWQVLRDFPKDSFRALTEEKLTRTDLPAHLEAGSSVDYQDLQQYYLFTQSNSSFEKWLAEQSGVESLGKRLNVTQDLPLPKLYANTCREVYCLQHALSFGHIPSLFWKSLIGVEDERFLEHGGIDYQSLLRALFTDIKEMRFAQGGSTLTQQLVKNLSLTNEKKLSRKFKEIVYAIYIETFFSKEEIIEGYLNEAYWGSLQGVRIKGLYSASLAYFAKKPQEINPFEVSILISLLKGPGFYSPLDHLDRLRQRAQVIFQKLKVMGMLPPDAESWSDGQWESWKKELSARHQEKYAHALWNTLNDTQLQNTEGFDGFDRYTMRRAVERLTPFLRQRTPDHWKNMAVKVFIGDLNNGKNFTYYSRPERQLEKAINDEVHLVGSILKPIAYSVFLDMGKKYDDMVSLAPISLKLISGKWSPSEAHEPPTAESTLIEALFHSYNRPIIRLAEELGWDEIEKRLEVYLPHMLKPLGQYPAQLLGGTERSVRQVFEIYQNFVMAECQKVRHPDLLEERNLLYKMSDPKLTTVRQVVGEDMGQLSFFGKTGTSNAGLDNWFVAFDGRLLSVVWLGFEGDRRGIKLNLYGAGTAFRIFQDFTLNRGKRFNELDCDQLVKK